MLRRLTDRVNDPAHILLRRGLRVAVLVPTVFFVCMQVLPAQEAGLPAAFATFSVLAFADFGGPALDRLWANLMLGVIGTVLFTVGALVGWHPVAAVLSTFVVAFVISFGAVLRGYFATATTAVLLPWVLAATTHPDISVLPEKSVGWAAGALVAAVGAAVLWPTHVRSTLRTRMADSLDAAADLVDVLISEPHEEVALLRWQRLAAAVTSLHDAYDGRLVRPGVGTARDRSLMLAFDQLHRLRTVLHAWYDDPGMQVTSADRALAGSICDSLTASAECLRRGYGVTQAEDLAHARAAHENELLAWANGMSSGDDPVEFRHEVDAAFHLRVVSMAAQVTAVYVQGALDSRDRTIGRRAARRSHPPVTFSGETIIDPARVTPVRELLAAQWTWRSPWLRTALRTGLALALTVLVVQLTGAAYGFWISLGALVALKVDAAGTRKTALSVFVGTLVGFVVATALVWLVGSHVWVFWLVLPVFAFLAAYTPAAVSLAVGQGSFTVFILSLFGIVQPESLGLGVTRVEDVAMGLAVALVVSLVIWPRGITPVVRRTLHLNAMASGQYLVAAYARLVEGPIMAETVHTAREAARHNLTVAGETFDLALAQASPESHAEVPVWATTLNCSSQISFAASVVSVLERVSALPVSSACGDAMLALSHHVSASIATSTSNGANVAGGASETIGASGTSGATPPPGAQQPPGRDPLASLQRMYRLLDDDLRALWREPATGNRGATALALIFAASWLSQSLWMAQRLASSVHEFSAMQLTAPAHAATDASDQPS